MQSWDSCRYNVPLFMKLKRLRDFGEDDWKNYYRTIDENLEYNANSSGNASAFPMIESSIDQS